MSIFKSIKNYVFPEPEPEIDSFEIELPDDLKKMVHDYYVMPENIKAKDIKKFSPDYKAQLVRQLQSLLDEYNIDEVVTPNDVVLYYELKEEDMNNVKKALYVMPTLIPYSAKQLKYETILPEQKFTHESSKPLYELYKILAVMDLRKDLNFSKDTKINFNDAKVYDDIGKATGFDWLNRGTKYTIPARDYAYAHNSTLLENYFQRMIDRDIQFGTRFAIYGD